MCVCHEEGILGNMLRGSSEEGSGRQCTLQDRCEGCRRRAHVSRECLCCHQSRTATSSSNNMATTVWIFFSPTPLAALAQKLRALARKACCGFCFRARACARSVFVTTNLSGPPPFGSFFRRRPLRRWRGNSTRCKTIEHFLGLLVCGHMIVFYFWCPPGLLTSFSWSIL